MGFVPPKKISLGGPAACSSYFKNFLHSSLQCSVNGVLPLVLACDLT